MFDKSAIEQVQKSSAETVEAANKAATHAASNPYAPLVVIPDNHTIKTIDTEKHQPHRLRFRGHMGTNSIKEFVGYCTSAETENAKNFVSITAMRSNCILNFGTRTIPGHCDDTATLSLETTPEYAALTNIAREPKTQKIIAEWLEDWADFICCYDANNEKLELCAAVNSVRKITIDSAAKIESETQSFSETKSAFETIEANRDKSLPAWIYFTCIPYSEISERTYEARLSLITGDKIQLRLRIRQLDVHETEIREELASKLTEGFGEKIKTTVGSFTLAN